MCLFHEEKIAAERYSGGGCGRLWVDNACDEKCACEEKDGFRKLWKVMNDDDLMFPQEARRDCSM